MTVHRTAFGSSVVKNDVSLYGTFDPILVAGLSISTILMDDPQPDDTAPTSTPSTTPSTSSPALTGVVGSILIAIILVSMMMMIIAE
jgi:hypothetical protein